MKCNTQQCCGMVAELLKLTQDQQRIIQVQKGLIDALRPRPRLVKGIQVRIITPPLN